MRCCPLQSHRPCRVRRARSPNLKGIHVGRIWPGHGSAGSGPWRSIYESPSLPVRQVPFLSLYFFLVVIVSLGCGTLPQIDVPISGPAFATAMLIVGWALLAHIGVRLIAKQANAGTMTPTDAVHLMERQLDAFRWLGLPVILLCLGGFGLGRVLDSIPVLSDWMVLRAAILLVPGMAITAATWSAENYYGMLVGFTPRCWKRHVSATAVAVRTGAAWLVMPVLVLMLMLDLGAMFIDEDATAAWVLPAIVILTVPVGLPLLMRVLFKTEGLNREQSDWITRLLISTGIRRTKVLRWNTQGMTFNAMVAGFIPPMRTLLVSDRVLDDLPKDQIAMVVLHEAAHLKRKHVPIRMMTVIPAWGAGVLVTHLAGSSDYAMPLGTVAGILLTILILRLVSYRTEFDADVQACRIAARLKGTVEGVPPTMEDATNSLSAALERISLNHPEITKSTWLHPGLADRLACLQDHNQPTKSRPIAGTIANPA